ncbi:HAMP domain-containing sensor histidine kinase [Neorhizobium alkalisoli]|uniref:histidine kinase n=1 Tax=Neorhizobium alkalisoli TaxID=528178 RepID=A0A561R8R8_9HYPH|nr:HAMP domain-containing sensor histidine kinase [Neorhizobium alkalisoli]TWF59032.1 signal transduction histidine kinase [Neorhizobium alkalisoli]
MRPSRLFRSTPFRLALTFGFLFTIAFLIAGMVAYQVLKHELFNSLNTSVKDTYAAIAATYSARDQEDLVTAVATYSNLNSQDDQIFLLVDGNGERIAGNVPKVAVSEGFSTISSKVLGLVDDDRFLVQAGPVGDNLLMVGQSYSEPDEFERIALVSFSWAAGIIIFLAFAGGAYLAGQAQKRLDGIGAAMTGVANGNLSVRIPVSHRQDDIDTVAGHMNSALDRLSALVEGMRQVSADIAHDLKTPLNRLRMSVEQALEKSADGGDIQNYLQDARDESDRINETFEALLRISQIEAGARKTRFRPVELAEVMSTVAEIYKSVAEDNGQVLEFFQLGEFKSTISGDRELLTQLFVNLVENSINHCKPGTVIRMSVASEGGNLVTTVADNGSGIPIPERDLVFRRLYRLDKSRTTPGNGLGLSLVKAIAELHSAQIALCDAEPGLAVVLHFPRPATPV